MSSIIRSFGRFSKFGFEIRDSVKFTASRKRFKRETNMDRPLEGDLLYLPLNRGLFEIKFVEHENPFYALGKLLSFQITCELFQYSEEKMDTGIPDIDVVQEDTGFNITLFLGATSGTGTFEKGDIVYQYADGSITGASQSPSAKATVLSYSAKIANTVVVNNVVGDWKTSNAQTMRYVTNNSSYRTIISVGDNFGKNIDQSNEIIQNEAEQYFNFSEKHPFGEP